MRYRVGRQPFYARESFAESFSNYDVINTRIDVRATPATSAATGPPSAARPRRSLRTPSF